MVKCERDLPISVVDKDIAIDAGSVGSIPGPVKLNRVSPAILRLSV